MPEMSDETRAEETAGQRDAGETDAAGVGPTTIVEHADVVKTEAMPAVQPKNDGSFAIRQSQPSWQSRLVVFGTGLLAVLKFLEISVSEVVAWAKGYAVDHEEQAFAVILVALFAWLTVWAHDRSMKRANERTLAAMDAHADPAKNNTTATP
jgi:hypothetical protein